jgi:hypothetical protein
MDPSSQEAHYEEIMEKHTKQQAAGLREWVEGTVQDMTAAAAPMEGGRA